jgi:hypothetical protein
MTFMRTDPQGAAKTLLDKVKTDFIAKFQMPNSEQQSCAELKEIKRTIDWRKFLGI